jgi:hypothetical protein
VADEGRRRGDADALDGVVGVPVAVATERSMMCSARKPATNISRAAGTPKTSRGWVSSASGSRSNPTTPSISPAASPRTRWRRSPMRWATMPPTRVIAKAHAAIRTGMDR